MIPGPNWARRYGTQHRRLCARPGCGTPAVATLRFHSTQREGFLVDLDGSSARVQGDLCTHHAESLVLPRGWELHDHRAEANEHGAPPLRLASVEHDVVTLASIPAQLDLIDEPRDEELADVLDARTPLLQRAFRNARLD
jgi:hypothetical protein